MILSLDTATVIDLARGRSAEVRNRYRAAAQARAEFVISAIVMHELVSGVVTSRDAVRERLRLDDTLVDLPIVEMTATDAETTGVLAGQLRRKGQSIGDIDTLIAGQALARGWTVVTGNVRHFGRVEGLALIDWSVGPDPLTADQIAQRVSQGD